MKPSRVRLAVCALLFLGWLGWLAYLAATTTRPVVLSRPQFLAADLYVIAELHADAADGKLPAKEVTVRQVVWSSARAADYEGKSLIVDNLPLVKGPAQGWVGPEEYILALTHRKTDGHYVITSVPRSPGYDPELQRSVPVRIYAATPTARRELQDLVKEFHRDAR
jgi:hypothetical protein